jgi:hypothetical protein
MAQTPFRREVTPRATTVWSQAETFFSGSIGVLSTRILDITIPKGLNYRRVYIAGGICFTGTTVPDAGTDNLEHRLDAEVIIRDEGTPTYDLLMYHNPGFVGQAVIDIDANRTKGPWPPCVLYRPTVLANLVPKLPDCDHPDTRFFTLQLKRQDSGGGAPQSTIAKALPLRMVASGDLLSFTITATAPGSGSTWGHWIVAVESSSQPF